MTNVARVRWLSKFDMEPLLSAVLLGGMMTGIGLIIAGLVVGGLTRQAVLEYRIRAASIPRFLEVDLQRVGAPDFWQRFLIDLGFSIVLITPFLRLVVTWLYFAVVQRRWIYVVYTAMVLLLLGMDMFTDVEFFPVISRALHWYPFTS